MEKSEFRVLIKHCFLMEKNTVEAKQWLDKRYPTSAPSKTTIKRWFADFKRGRTSTEDAERSGRPSEAVNPENIQKIHRIVSNDQRAKLSEIAESVGISKERAGFILHEHLGMKKLSARWVPRLLTLDQKQQRVDDSERGLALFRQNTRDFLHRFVTMDEIWIHYTPESALSRLEAGSSRPKRPRTKQSAGKVLVSIFWDAHGIIFIDYLKNRETITGNYYVALLDRLDQEIKEKRPHIAKKKVLFHHDNTPIHSSAKVTVKLAKLRYELVHQPPYSPDLAPSDYYLFPKLKKFFHGKRFSSNVEVIDEMEAYFADLEKSCYSEGIEMLEDRWSKCIELDGDYIEE